MAEVDLVVVGGGPVGATLALGLRESGLNVVVLEARPDAPAPADLRAIALSYGSRLILQRLGLWGTIAKAATPIHTIHVSEQFQFGRALLTSRESGIPELGCVVEYRVLYNALADALARSGIPVMYGSQASTVEPSTDSATVRFKRNGVEGEMRARLLAVADGGKGLGDISGIQRNTRDYGQVALVAQVETELPHGNVAYERFTARGPVALLPWGERGFALVWTETPENAQSLLELNESVFLQQLHAHFGDRLGSFLRVSNRGIFPLRLVQARPVTAAHLALIGNAAQTLHPVAGQGFNLGLRDAWELAQLTLATPPPELGGIAMLQRYASHRLQDTQGGILFTDFLVRAFSNDIPALGQLRGLGLSMLEMLAPAKRYVVGKMSLGARG